MSLIKEKLELKAEEAEFFAQEALKGFPPFLKWILIVLLISLIPGYFVAKTFAYNYWHNKLTEFEVSAKPSFSNPNPLEQSQANLVTYSDGSFGSIAKITNSNKELSVGELNYTWHYYGLNGEIVQPVNSEATGGRAYILPSSSKYIIAPKINTTEIISRAELVLIEPIKWQKKLNLPQILLSTSPAGTLQQLNPFQFSADSTVFNNSPYQLKQVRLSFLVYSQDGSLVAVSQRNENDLKPFERRAFKQLWPGLYLTSSKVEILAETNLLDPSNLTIPKSENGSSDLSRPENENNWGF